jgi:hypothetical protein
MKHPDTKCDLAAFKTVRMNGMKLGGVSAVSINYDMDKQVTEVVLKMAIKKESMKIDGDSVSFDSFMVLK